MQKIQTDRLTRWPTDGQNHSLVELWCLPEEVSVSRGFEWMIMGTILTALMWCRDLAHKKTDMEGKLLWVVIKARCERHVISRRHGKIGSMIRTKKKNSSTGSWAVSDVLASITWGTALDRGNAFEWCNDLCDINCHFIIQVEQYLLFCRSSLYIHQTTSGTVFYICFWKVQWLVWHPEACRGLDTLDKV